MIYTPLRVLVGGWGVVYSLWLGGFVLSRLVSDSSEWWCFW